MEILGWMGALAWLIAGVAAGVAPVAKGESTPGLLAALRSDEERMTWVSGGGRLMRGTGGPSAVAKGLLA